MVDARAVAASSSDDCSAIVFGSRKSSRLSASATTIADLPSGVKYMLYGSSTAIALPGLPVFGSIGVRLPSVRALGVVGDPQRLQVPRRHDVLRVEADLELVDHLERRRVDHVDVVRLHVRHVDARQVARDRRAQLAGGGLAVEVGGIGHRRHAGHRVDRGAADAAMLAATARAAASESATQRRSGEERRVRFTEAPRKVPATTCRSEAVELASATRDLAPDRIARARDDQRRRRSGRAAALARRGSPSTPSAAPSALPAQPVAAHQPRVDRERQRGVGERRRACRSRRR